MKKMIFLGMLVAVMLTGCESYRYADQWTAENFTMVDASSESIGEENPLLSEILEENKQHLVKNFDRKSQVYLLWQNFDELEILQIEDYGKSNMEEGMSDAYYNRKDNTIYVTSAGIAKGRDELTQTICHEAVHALTWTDQLDPMLAEGIADFYALRVLSSEGIQYDLAYVNQTSVVLYLDACYPEEFLELAMSGKLPERIDHDLGKPGMGQKLMDAVAAEHYYGVLNPDSDKCYEAAEAQFDILAHLARKTAIDPEMAIGILESYGLPHETYFKNLIKRTRE